MCEKDCFWAATFQWKFDKSLNLFLQNYEMNSDCLLFLRMRKYQKIWIDMMESDKLIVIDFFVKHNYREKLLILVDCLSVELITRSIIEACVAAFYNHYTMDLMLEALGIEDSSPQFQELKSIAQRYSVPAQKKCKIEPIGCDLIGCKDRVLE